MAAAERRDPRRGQEKKSPEQTFLQVLEEARGPAILQWGPGDFARAVHWAQLVDQEEQEKKKEREQQQQQQQQRRRRRRRQQQQRSCVANSSWSHCGQGAARTLLDEIIFNDSFYDHAEIVPLLSFVLQQLKILAFQPSAHDDDDDDDGDDEETDTLLSKRSRGGGGGGGGSGQSSCDAVLFRAKSTRRDFVARSAAERIERKLALPPGFAETAAAATLLNNELHQLTIGAKHVAVSSDVDTDHEQQAGGKASASSEVSSCSSNAAVMRELIRREREFVRVQPAAADIVAVQILQPETCVVTSGGGFGANTNVSTRTLRRGHSAWSHFVAGGRRAWMSSDVQEESPGHANPAQRSRGPNGSSSSSSSSSSSNDEDDDDNSHAAVAALLLPILLSAPDDTFLAIHPHFLGLLSARYFVVARRYLSLLLAQLRRIEDAVERSSSPGADLQPRTVSTVSTTADEPAAADPDPQEFAAASGSARSQALARTSCRRLASLAKFSPRLSVLCADAISDFVNRRRWRGGGSVVVLGGQGGRTTGCIAGLRRMCCDLENTLGLQQRQGRTANITRTSQFPHAEENQ